MPVDPFLVPLLGELPALPDPIEDFDTWREQGARDAEAILTPLLEPGPEVGSIHDVQIPVSGEAAIDLRIYRPAGEGPHAAHLFLHGGGWIAGSIHSTQVDVTCRERCAGAECVVVAVNYRKAPEHPFPIPMEDCQAALRWVADHAESLGIHRDAISIGGQSAGANLAAGLVLKLRNDGGPRLTLQLLEVPLLDATLNQSSYTEYGNGYGLDAPDIARMIAWYVPDPDQRRSPYVSPLLAEDLADLPETYVISAEYDPLRDDGELYVRRLQEAGAKATFSLQPGHLHFSSALTKVMPAARDWRDELIAVLRRAQHVQRDAQALHSV